MAFYLVVLDEPYLFIMPHMQCRFYAATDDSVKHAVFRIFHFWTMKRVRDFEAVWLACAREENRMASVCIVSD